MLLIVLSLTLSANLFAQVAHVAVCQATPLPTTSNDASLLSRLVADLGDPSALASLKAIRYTTVISTGTEANPVNVEVTQTRAYPDRFVMSTRILGATESYLEASPTGAFVQPSGGSRTSLPEAMRDELLKTVRLDRFYVGQNIGSSTVTVKDTGTEQIDGVEAAVLHIDVEGAEATWYVGRADGRLLRTVAKVPVMGGMVDSVVDYSDWRSCDGLTVSFQRAITQGGRASQEKVLAVELNPSMAALPSAGVTLHSLFATNVLAAGYKGIKIGQPISALPSEVSCSVVFCEGTYKGDFWRVSTLDGKVLDFDVIYVGASLDNSSRVSKNMTLSKAIRIHSLQPGLAAPDFGLAKDNQKRTYGVVDKANAILYKVVGAATDPTSAVAEVSYLSRDAPVLRARTIPEAAALVRAAQAEEVHDETILASAPDSPKVGMGQSPTTMPKPFTPPPSDPWSWVIAQSAAQKNPDLRKVKWGMTQAEVLATEPTKPSNSHQDQGRLFLTYGDIKLVNLDARLVYIFVSDKLLRAKYIFVTEHTNKNDFLEDYFNIDDGLNDKYGKAKMNADWKNQLYLDDKSQWGFAISLGHLALKTRWENPRTKIGHYLDGENYQITHQIEYVSVGLEALEDSLLSSQSKDAL
jgi:hypothetical protein